jgi:Ca-activated chloride channel family protein
MMELAYPQALLLLLLPLLGVWRTPRTGGETGRLRFAHLPLLASTPAGARGRAYRLLRWLPALALVLLVLGLARPRIPHASTQVEGEGIDIMLALDISGSMRALDFQPQDRLGVAKQVIRDFIDARPQDRIGLVVFAAKAFTQCPLTLDRSVLDGFLDEVQVGLIDDGTAIGLGLATAVGRLKHSQAASKVVILLTDGLNNVPTLDPETAAELAEAMGVRVYTIGVGREGYAPYPVDDPVFGRRIRRIETHIDEALLRRIADRTGGQMFRAEDPEALAQIFATIDRLERSRYEATVSTFYRELAPWFAAPALLLIVLGAVLEGSWLRRLP